MRATILAHPPRFRRLHVDTITGHEMLGGLSTVPQRSGVAAFQAGCRGLESESSASNPLGAMQQLRPPPTRSGDSAVMDREARRAQSETWFQMVMTMPMTMRTQAAARNQVGAKRQRFLIWA